LAATWSGHGQWEPGLVDAALVGATVVLAFFLVAMVRLAVLDWLCSIGWQRGRVAVHGLRSVIVPMKSAPQRSSRDPTKAIMRAVRSRTTRRYVPSCAPIVMPSR
jgi:hypothetical protein